MILDIANLQGDGQRQYQQDFFALSDADPAAVTTHGFDLVLADGMGGALDGAEIARETVDLLYERLVPVAPSGTPRERPMPATSNEQVLSAIEEANTRIYQRYHESGGTTLVVARIREGQLWFASVGDSNVYLRRRGRLLELTRRHEYLYDLYDHVLDGLLSIEDARDNPQAKALSSFIGSGSLRIDHSQEPFALESGDVLLVCSDGISDTLTTTQLLEASAQSAQHCCDLLEDMIKTVALPNQDNYTAIVVCYA
ncbi:MAG: SpoIIE family protein phosphatase [Coriobacteriales bacterium]|jgi:serine/threonine protein phosphatase PrpC|nr:SpoIIE family protein phosphatase [Coriobacteriales bacterium]